MLTFKRHPFHMKSFHAIPVSAAGAEIEISIPQITTTGDTIQHKIVIQVPALDDDRADDADPLPPFVVGTDEGNKQEQVFDDVFAPDLGGGD